MLNIPGAIPILFIKDKSSLKYKMPTRTRNVNFKAISGTIKKICPTLKNKACPVIIIS